MRYDGKLSGHIFLYSIVIYDGFLVPIFNMLTEIHNANFITFWLKEFLRLGGSVPDEYCVDMSLALLNAGVNAFTVYSNLVDYVNAVFALNFDNTAPAPACFIRIDIAHLMKNVAKFKDFPKEKPKIKETYLYCMGLLLKETNIDEVRKLILSVLVMAYSSTEGINFKFFLNHHFL